MFINPSKGGAARRRVGGSKAPTANALGVTPRADVPPSARLCFGGSRRRLLS